jgi:hypothetical protein
MGAYNPGGAQGLSGLSIAQQRARSEGFLYWLAWTAQNTVSLFSTSDAQGPWRRIFLAGIPCALLTAPLQGQVSAISGQIPTLPPPLNTQFGQLQTTLNTINTTLMNAGVCT